MGFRPSGALPIGSSDQGLIRAHHVLAVRMLSTTNWAEQFQDTLS